MQGSIFLLNSCWWKGDCIVFFPSSSSSSSSSLPPPRPYPFPLYLTVLKDNSPPHCTYSKPHYGFPELHSNQTTQPTDARCRACVPILTLIPVHAPNYTHTLKTSGALSGALRNAAWRLHASLNQLAHIIRSFEETPGNAGIPLDIIPFSPVLLSA